MKIFLGSLQTCQFIYFIYTFIYLNLIVFKFMKMPYTYMQQTITEHLNKIAVNYQFLPTV